MWWEVGSMGGGRRLVGQPGEGAVALSRALTEGLRQRTFVIGHRATLARCGGGSINHFHAVRITFVGSLQTYEMGSAAMRGAVYSRIWDLVADRDLASVSPWRSGRSVSRSRSSRHHDARGEPARLRRRHCAHMVASAARSPIEDMRCGEPSLVHRDLRAAVSLEPRSLARETTPGAVHSSSLFAWPRNLGWLPFVCSR